MTLSFDLNMDFTGIGSKSEPYDVIVIGGGPGGTAAAIYTARSELRTLVIDKGLTGALGITSKISNYPGVPGTVTGAELVETMRHQAESFGAEFITDKVVGVDLSVEPKLVFAGTNTFEAKVIILATGSMGRTKVVKGESELLGRGVSYCATCDGAFFRDQTVAVVGNNDETLKEALFLTKYAHSVELIIPTRELKARESLITEAKQNGKINIRFGTRLKKIIGESNVSGVRIYSREGNEEVLPVSGAFVYLQGGQPITDYLMDQLEISTNGCLSVDNEMQTNVPGVYAVGDLLCRHIKQAVIAASDGVIAAVVADKYVNERNKMRNDWN